MRRLLPILVLISASLPLAIASAAAAPSSHATTTTTTIPSSPVTQIPTSPYGPCINNDCPSSGTTITYNGGPLLTAPVIYLVNFSDSRTNLSPSVGFDPSTFSATAPNAAGAALATVNSNESWWRTEYSVPGYSLGAATYGGTITLFNPSLADQILVSDSAIQQALTTARASGQLPASSQAIYVTFLRLGQISYIGSLATNSSLGYCAYHSFNQAQTYTYAVIPNDSTGPGCPATVANDTTTTPFDSLTSAISHEVTETITDPFQSGWYQATNTPATAYSAGEEIADLCVGSGISGTASNDAVVPYAGTSYVLQFEYSNSAQACLSAPLAPSLLLTQNSSTSVSARLYTPDEGVAGIAVALTTPAGTSSEVTNSLGVASFTTSSLAPGSTITATSTTTGGVASSTSSTVTTAAAAPTISVTQEPLADPTGPIALAVTLTPITAGTLDVFGPFGQILVTANVSASGPTSIDLSSSTAGDADTVVYYGPANAATSTITIASVSTISVTATGSPTLENQFYLTVQVSPAESGVSVYTDIDGLSNLTTTDQATNSAGIASVPVEAPHPGLSTVAVNAIPPHGIISTDVVLDFRATVSLTTGTVNAGVISLTVADQEYTPYANSPLTIRVGSAAPLTLTTDSTGTVTLAANPSPGDQVTLSWPQSADYTKGFITFFAPDLGPLTVAAFTNGRALTTAGPDVSAAACQDAGHRVSCKYSNEVSASQKIKGLSSLRIYSNHISVLGRHPKTIALSPKDQIYITFANTGFLESTPELAVASANGKPLWHS